MRNAIFPAASLLILACVSTSAQEKPAKPPDHDVDEQWFDPVDAMGNAGTEIGAQLYSKYCMMCHGEKGDGKGPLSESLDPRPRDFTSGVFKCRSTPNTTLPAKMDMMRAIVHGIPLSPMLSYSFLSTEEQVAMMEHVKSLCRKPYYVDGKTVQLNPFEREGHGKPLKSGNIPQKDLPVATPGDLAAGKALYIKHLCVECHGEKGDGKGPKAEGLKYDDGFPISVRNFTQGIYSGGPDIRHLYLRISLGIQGTPMASFSEVTTVKERWQLAQYAFSLSERKEKPVLPHSEILKAKKVAALPKDPDAAAWNELIGLQAKKDKEDAEKRKKGEYGVQEFYTLGVFFQQLKYKIGRPYYFPATIRALHDGKEVGILVEWEDSAASTGVTPDGLELQWSPSRLFQFAVHGTKVKMEAGETAEAYAQRVKESQTSLWRWSAKDPAGVVELDAYGPFEEKAQPAAQQNVKAAARWKNGKWRVLFTRAVESTPSDAPFDIGGANPILLHLWDGDFGDTGLQHLFTTWHRLQLMAE